MTDGTDVTRLLAAVSAGEDGAADELYPMIYGELRRLARSRMRRERPGHTLQATALVHEAYLRLLGGGEGVAWSNRRHFFGAAAQAMRRILIERARRVARVRHGGGQQRIDLDDVSIGLDPRSEELLALDRALDRLEEKDEQMALVVKLRYFAGLTVPETAAALEASPRTVNRQWTAARAWLHRELSQAEDVVSDGPDTTLP